MQKIILYTNVLVSSLIQKSFPYKILDEYYEVLHRPKFAKYPDFVVRAEILLADIESMSVMYSAQINIDLLSDKDDNMILELADVCEADYIVTSNTNDF
jgi:putative PIN family toxin of toxin-antitoxin system